MTEAVRDPVLFTALSALLGLFVGSFLNVVIHRLPKMMERDWQLQAAELRGKVPDSVDIGGITFIRYRGKVGSTPLIGDDDSYTVPTGVPGLLIGRFAPAPYNETVNTIGLPIYAKALEKRNGTGWDLEMQSNPLHILTRPRAVIKGTLT